MGDGAEEETSGLGQSDRDLETIRALYSHWERGDFTYANPFAEDFVWAPVDAIESGENVGLAASREAWRTWLQSWEGFRIEAEEVIPAGGGRYVVMQVFRGRGKVSGLESEDNRSAVVVTLRDGMIVRMEGYWDRNKALRAALEQPG
jgi:ketosteroid isomerase-like protein